MNVDIYWLPSRIHVDAEDAARPTWPTGRPPTTPARPGAPSRCSDSCSSAGAHRLGHLAAGLGPLLVDDLPALGASLVADGGRLGACAGHRLVVVGLGGRDLLGRLAVVRSGLGQHGLPLGEHLADRWHNPFRDHAEHDQEDEQHDEEGAVGDQEVARLRRLLPPPTDGCASVHPCRRITPTRRGEDEQRHERQVDEVRGLHQTDGDEERSEQAALRLRLPGDAGDQCVTGDTVTDTGADGTATP